MRKQPRCAPSSDLDADDQERQCGYKHSGAASRHDDRLNPLGFDAKGCVAPSCDAREQCGDDLSHAQDTYAPASSNNALSLDRRGFLVDGFGRTASNLEATSSPETGSA